MRLMSNEILIDSYFKALDLKLEAEFVKLLREEIRYRNINLEYYEDHVQVS
jgi:developmental checkpoint coupling sporulation initiation to replication initiation